MIQAIRQLMTFEEFLNWYPEDGRYELINGEVIEVRPRGDHEDVTSQIVRLVDREIERLGLDWFIPKTCCVKPVGNLDGYVPDMIVLDRAELRSEPLWKTASTITQGRSARLVVEVVSTNWHDDYAKKLEDYESLGIPEYWIADYRALGGRRFIGLPKQPTVSVYSLVNGVYELAQFRLGDMVRSAVFPELELRTEQILQVAE
ncbi:MAG: Uma2 family endonuclease [Thermostichus sp. BF3_bins_97]